MAKLTKVPVGKRALVRRINRELDTRGKGDRLKLSKSHDAIEQFGAAYVLRQGGGVSRHHVDLDSFARELGVLAEHEQYVDDD